MPVTVYELFDQFNIDIEGRVNWRTQVDETGAGIYIVSTSDDPIQNNGIIERPLFALEVVNAWRAHAENMRLNNQVMPTTEQIISELSTHWHNNENILYIGKTDNLQRRINYYYNHVVGRNSPHRGGYWLKALSNFQDFFVYYGTHDTPLNLEADMLKFFAERNAGQPWNEISDPCKYIPFANLEIKAADFKGRKKHSFRKATK